MSFCLKVLSFVTLATTVLSQGSFDCSVYPRECSSSPCTREEIDNCRVYNDGTGCSQCDSGYFAPDFNHQCDQCQAVFGNQCRFCQVTGCGQCRRGYARRYDEQCGLWYCDDGTIDNDTPSPTPSPVGDFAYLFTDEEFNKISTTKRIRRNIYDLSIDEWNDIATAMNIMKHVSEEDGQLIYGLKYRNYDSMVCQHGRGTLHRFGDLGHEGPHFLTWHRAFLLAFEDSLIAINPNIKGLPYWNFLDDVAEYGYDLSNSPMFSDKYFGDFVGDKNLNYQITNGKFAFWKVNDDPASVGCPVGYQNAYGLLRSRQNHLDNRYVTRNGGSWCNLPYTYYEETPFETYPKCLELTDDDVTINEFNDCSYFDVHVTSHNAISGTFEKFEGQSVIEDLFPPIGCISLVFAGENIDLARVYYSQSDCITCPEPGSCIIGEDDPLECAACKLNEETNGSCQILGRNYSINAWDETVEHFYGDFGDLATSTNEPMFWFHHANVDRYFMEWQLRVYDRDINGDPYYGFPTEGWAQGINLDDILADEFPFVNLFDESLGLGNGPYTNRDILDGTQILNAQYTYDTVIELIER